jgi:hypothetical protein
MVPGLSRFGAILFVALLASGCSAVFERPGCGWKVCG